MMIASTQVWAVLRLIRAMWLFGRIFCSYMLQLALRRIFGRERMRARWKTVHRRNARRMYKGFVSLRGVYIKLGQILSIMGTFLPRAYGEELEGLQDEVPRVAFPALRQLDEGLATAVDMDTTLKLGLGYPQGPIELLERSGLHHHYDVTEALFEATGDPDHVLADPARADHAHGLRRRFGARRGRGDP